MIARLFLLSIVAMCLAGSSVAEFGIVAASKNVRDGISGMRETVERLPEGLRLAVADQVGHVSEEANALLDRIEGRTAPILDERVAGELDHLDEIISHLGEELSALEASGAKDLDDLLERRIDQLGAVAGAQIDHIDSELDVWLDKAERSIITFERDAEAIIIREFDKTEHFIVRMIALVMFVSGLFVVSLRLVQASHANGAWWQVQPDNTVPLFLGIVMMALAFGTTAALAARPDLLLGAYADAEVSQVGSCLSAELREGHVERLAGGAPETLVYETGRKLDSARRDCRAGSA